MTRAWQLLGLAVLASLTSGCGPNPRKAFSISLDPKVLTLPTGAFHYDPLVTLRDQNGQAVWVDLPTEVRAVSSNPQVATVNERVRIQTTDHEGSAEITIHYRKDPSVQARLKLTTLDATLQQIQVEGPTNFDAYVGQALPLEVTAAMSSGDLIPRAQASSDLDLVTGTEYAAIVDGLGISALKPSPPKTPIAIGFGRGGGKARGSISVRSLQLVKVELRLGGNPSPSQDFVIPSGYRSVLEVVGTFEDGTSKQLQVGQDYWLTLAGDAGFTFPTPGTLSQPLAGQTATLKINLRDEIDGSFGRSDGVDLSGRVTTVDGSRLQSLSANFENYPEDQRLLFVGQGYARELRVLADFPGLKQYRVSGFEPIWTSASFATRGLSRAGWPTLKAATASGSGPVQLGLAGRATRIKSVSVVEPKFLSVSALGKRLAERIPLELGQHLAFRTLVDYGDGVPLSRTSDYPVVEFLAQNAGRAPFWKRLDDATTVFLNVPSASVTADGFKFQARDAEDRPVQSIGSGSQGLLKVDVARQSDPD